jgi:hypothetical protein
MHVITIPALVAGGVLGDAMQYLPNGKQLNRVIYSPSFPFAEISD